MGRIEDALAKLQAEHASAQSRRPIGRVAIRPEGDQSAHHVYGGKRIEIDFAALRSQGLLAPNAQQQRLVDQYRVLKRPLLKNASTAQPMVECGNLLMVGSALAGEGKTFTSINLCLSIAREQDWSVILVDGDAMKPHLTRSFGAEGETGFVDLLREPSVSFDSIVMETNIPCLSFVPAGKQHDRTVELLTSAKMAALCAEISAADQRRLIVFDSGPLLLCTESPALASQVGQVLLIVRANKTPRQAVLDARDKLDPAKAISLLLNQAEFGDTMTPYGGGDMPYSV